MKSSGNTTLTVGTLLPMDTLLCFHPVANYFGTVTIKLKACYTGLPVPPTTKCSNTTQTINIIVKPINDRPKCTNRNFMLPEVAMTSVGIMVKNITGVKSTVTDPDRSGDTGKPFYHSYYVYTGIINL